MRLPMADLIGQRFLLRQGHCAHLADRSGHVLDTDMTHALLFGSFATTLPFSHT
jgi:hypothetical protein